MQLVWQVRGCALQDGQYYRFCKNLQTVKSHIEHFQVCWRTCSRLMLGLAPRRHAAMC